MKKTLKDILLSLKVNEEVIKSLSGEMNQEIEIDDNLSILSSEDKETLIKNSKKEAQTAAREILIKEMKTMAGIEFEGKTPEKFIENYKTHVLKDANVSVDEKIKEKDIMVNELRKKLTEKDDEFAKLNNSLLEVKQNTMFQAAFPKNRDTKFKDEDYLMLLKSKVQLQEEDGVSTITFNGKKLQDDKLNPLPIDKAFEMVFKEQGWVSVEPNKTQGGGFGDSGRVPNIFNKTSDIKNWAQANGKEFLSEEVSAKMVEAIAANPNFIYD